VGSLARAYLALTWLAGTGLVFHAVWNVDPAVPARQYVEFALLFTGAVAGAPLKVRLPGVFGTLSINFIFVLLAIMDLGAGPAVVTAACATALQCLVGTNRKPRADQVAFSVAAVTIAAWLGAVVFENPLLRRLDSSTPVMLFWTVGVYFLVNTLLVAGAIALTTQKTWLRTWHQNFFWTAPQFMAGALLAWLIQLANSRFGWQYLVLVVPALYMIYHSYSIYMGQLAREMKQVDDAMRLQKRTIEALALAIEASDDTTLSHLRRMQIFSSGVARELGLSGEEIQAIEAAALLHDVGKLAVPDYIMNKPGRLTKEEYERLKVHPEVGAEILEAVDFPYPVVPIVRAHHERWDGSGYPDGLKGHEIPVGARILAVVDTLDALSSDRRYRKAIPIQDALRVVIEEKGKTFDPQVVEALERSFEKLEADAATALARDGRLAGAGAARTAGRFVHSIANARQEFQRLHEMTHDLGSSLSMEDTFALLTTRLMSLVRHDALAIFTLEENFLFCRHAVGIHAADLRRLRLAAGEGLSGLAVSRRSPLVNGDAAREFAAAGLLPEGGLELRSALAVPLEVSGKVTGTLTLYRLADAAFTHDDLRLILAIAAKTALTIENALHFQRTEKSAGTDQLTGLPNSAALFEHLEEALRQLLHTPGSLGVTVMDLDGFKHVNDRFGHLAGNRVLQLVSEGFRANCRGSDYVARMGGDEFVVVLPNITPEAMAERILEFTYAVEAAGEQVCGERLVSLSAGAARFPEDGTTVEALLESADKRMFAVKQQHHEENPALSRS
jgi:diguanylate cyclase (GGDEF)-like protein/putative nucleotidyltransferase with HDIG domain